MTTTLTKLKDYTPQDFQQWKNSGLTQIFFQYLTDKNKDIQNLVLADFNGWQPLKPETYTNRQAFAACLREVCDMDLQSMIEYYEGKEEND